MFFAAVNLVQRVSCTSSCFSASIAKRGIVHASQKSAAFAFPNFEEMGLKYPMTTKPAKIIKTGMWTPPPVPLGAITTDHFMPGIPFAVSRTENASLPVYTDYKGGRTKVITILRRIRGDIFELQSEMSKVCDGREVIIRPGKLVVDGNYHARLKIWLSGLGFWIKKLFGWSKITVADYF